MSKPLYMQVEDLQKELNKQRTHNRYVHEELTEARQALAAAEAARREAEGVRDKFKEMAKTLRDERDIEHIIAAQFETAWRGSEQAKVAAEADAARYAEALRFYADPEHWGGDSRRLCQNTFIAASVGDADGGVYARRALAAGPAGAGVGEVLKAAAEWREHDRRWVSLNDDGTITHDELMVVSTAESEATKRLRAAIDAYLADHPDAGRGEKKE